MGLTAEQRQQQIQQAEELLFSGPQTLGFAKGLFFGHFNAPLMFPYPQLPAAERDAVAAAVAETRRFCLEKIDSFQIDQEARIPDEVIQGLAEIGVLGMTIPREYGGRGMSQMGYCKVMEVIGGHDGSIAVFVNAHQSIGLRGLLIGGTEEQKRRWLRPMTEGKALAAFALTEPEAGSDAASVRTQAIPTPDGAGYILNGEKRYITNGGIAQLLTVMARAPVPGKEGTHVTAFLVTPDMPGFQVLEARMAKCGIRGTATGRLAFKDMFVPKENILGQLGKGLKLALTVLDFGRITFGATCTGAAGFCLDAAVRHANSRRQFGQTLGEFELVKKKIALMAADVFAMQSAVQHCAWLIDSGKDDYMVETAMLKVFASEQLWRIVNDTLQIYGGQGYFSNEPYERMMRDARINLIGEGANDVLRCFIAAVGGVRNVAMNLLEVREALYSPIRKFGTLRRYLGRRLSATFLLPEVPVVNAALRPAARQLARRVRDLGKAVEAVLMKYREEIVERQYQLERLAEAGTEAYMSSCVISRIDSLLTGPHPPSDRELAAGRYYLRVADRRIRQSLAALWDNDDEATTAAANRWLASGNAEYNGQPGR
jgi:acyl-CoA dehydrogenase family protein 9